MVTRIDAIDKVTGRAVYAEDIFLPDMIHAVPLHAKFPHARILKIDASQARKISGVVDVITAADIPGKLRVGNIRQDHFVLAKDRTLYHGDVVAMIAAETREAAYAARDAVSVEYEPLPASFSPEDSLKSGALKIHPEYESNVCAHFVTGRGNVDWAGKVIIERKYKTQHIEHAYLEPEGCVAIADKDGSVTVRGGMQHPFTTQKFVAAVTGLSINKVRIIQTTLGGGFGGKDDTISIICARAAVIAMRTKRPVKIVYTREESVRESYKRHPFSMRYKAAVKKDGTFDSIDVDITADAGAYCSSSPFVIWRPTVQCTGPYVYPNVKCNSRAIYTNNTFTGAMRGFGSPQINFAIESFVDEIAAELKLDPVELRRKNFFRQGVTTHTGQTLDRHRVSIEQVVDAALGRIGWNEKFAKCSRGRPDANGNFYGVGMACSYRGVSLGAEGKDFCAAIIAVQPDAKIQLEVGVAENGQGLKTAMAHICATELGISEDKIIYKDLDTLAVPDSCPTVASRGTLVGGNAILNGVKQIKEKLRPVLAGVIGQASKEYIFRNSEIKNPENGKTVSFEDAVSACHSLNVGLHALGVWHGPRTSWHEDTGQGDAYFTYVYGCQAVEISVDGKTGKIRALKAVGAHDVGKAVNPQMAMGQIYGGMIMGLGFAIKEELIHKEGVIQNLNFNKYRILTSVEIPEMEAILVENGDPAGPWGAKALGEPVNELMGGAMANAVYYATGVRARELPITAEKIMQTLNSKF